MEGFTILKFKDSDKEDLGYIVFNKETGKSYILKSKEEVYAELL